MQSRKEKKTTENDKDSQEGKWKKEDTAAQSVRKVAKHCVFSMICRVGGLKSRLAKLAGADPPAQVRNEKLRATVVRSASSSQDVQNTVFGPVLEAGMKENDTPLRAKHIFKSKCTKHTMLGRKKEREREREIWRDEEIER